MKELEKILCQVFRLKKDEVKDELTMNDIQVWDSLTHMDIITCIEEELSIQLTIDDIMNMRDIGAIKKIVSEKLV
ncbi:acyl carrier protein [Francisella noatunensis]|uniref:Acyl carrier protein n=1 Tax=Francisella noatunensis TaxID=657445 RepID=A0A9Q2KWB7_9GAMM|nr:acyl carrier protein [Francisella noatunensis]MBK2028543.1 acyl carrier protein [Francisella noatunensis]MBK2034198.1 acyl carrier protein [Francisella noatunensis]MBK2048517.1 acyl carrier protein [Francisella noatunensis]MBK2050719.1 acyl carrier protein [Francisella noatunensis]MBK2051783.1 acyl carrier protein [Francisella noatunensis]